MKFGRIIAIAMAMARVAAGPVFAKGGVAINNFVGAPYCVEFTEDESAYLRDVCITSLHVEWGWDRLMGAPLENYKGTWFADDTVRLSGAGGEPRTPVAMLPAAIETAYAKIKPRSFFATALSSSTGSGGGKRLYFALDLVETSGKRPLFSVPGMRDWEDIFGEDAEANSPARLCPQGGVTRRPQMPQTLLKEDAQRVFANAGLGEPEVCSVRFNGVSEFNRAIDAHCKDKGPEALNGVCAVYCKNYPNSEKCKAEQKEEPEVITETEEEAVAEEVEEPSEEERLADLFDEVIQEETGAGKTDETASDDPFAQMLAEEEVRAEAARAEAERKRKAEEARQRQAAASADQERKKSAATAAAKPTADEYVLFKMDGKQFKFPYYDIQSIFYVKSTVNGSNHVAMEFITRKGSLRFTYVPGTPFPTCNVSSPSSGNNGFVSEWSLTFYSAYQRLSTGCGVSGYQMSVREVAGYVEGEFSGTLRPKPGYECRDCPAQIVITEGQFRIKAVYGQR